MKIQARIASFKALTLLTLAGFPSWVDAATIIHTNDVSGELEPCGCRTNPQGGMPRKANFMKRLADKSLLQLDAGDLLFPTLQIPQLLTPQSEAQAAYLLRSMDLVGHDAVTPGEKDFAMGVKIFDKLRKKSKVKFLAANLKRKNGKPFLEHSAIFNLKDGETPVKVAVLGLVGEAMGWPSELKATSAIAAAKAEVPALRKKADFVVALTHQGLEEDEKLAKAVPGIDVIIGAHSQSFLQHPLQVGSTWIYQSSFRNQYVGAIPLSKPFKQESYQLVGLDPGYDSPADAPSAMDDLVKEFKKSIAEMNSRQEAMMQATADAEHAKESAHSGGAAAEVKYQTFPRCAECHMKQFDFWRKTAHAGALHPLVEKEQFKNRECLSCHTVGLGDAKGFINSAHLAEYQKTLPLPSPSPTPKAASVEGDENTGEVVAPAIAPTKTEYLTGKELDTYLQAIKEAKSLNDKVKFTSADAEALPLRRSLSALTRAWTPVQCENCHNAGYNHPFTGTYTKKVENTSCLKCHTAERAPEWYSKPGQPDWEKIAAKRASITCPAGELSETE